MNDRIEYIAPPEQRELFARVEPLVDAKAEELLTHKKLGMPQNQWLDGACHTFWEYKKQILKDEYGIDWQSPAELNPHILFD